MIAFSDTESKPFRRNPISPAKIAANRTNARKSTGPRTPAGKRKGSLNALKYGVCSNTALIPGECEHTFNTFRREIEEDLTPRTVIQRILCTRIVNVCWKLQRIQHAEAKLFDLEAQKISPDDLPDPQSDPVYPPCTCNAPSPRAASRCIAIQIQPGFSLPRPPLRMPPPA